MGIFSDSESPSPLFIKTDCILRIVRLRGADLDRVPKVLHEAWHDAMQLAYVSMFNEGMSLTNLQCPLWYKLERKEKKYLLKISTQKLL